MRATMSQGTSRQLLTSRHWSARAAGTGGGRAGRDAALRRASASQCHEADDWEGEDAASLESLIRDIVAGKVKHKGKLELSGAEIANIAAYWGQGKK